TLESLFPCHFVPMLSGHERIKKIPKFIGNTFIHPYYVPPFIRAPGGRVLKVGTWQTAQPIWVKSLSLLLRTRGLPETAGSLRAWTRRDERANPFRGRHGPSQDRIGERITTRALPAAKGYRRR